MKLSYNARYNIRWIASALTMIGATAAVTTGIIGGTTLILIGISKFIVAITGTNTFLEMFCAAAYILVYMLVGAILVIAMIVAIMRIVRALF